MKMIQALHDRTVFIGELDDCISVCTLGQETAFLEAEHVEELIEVLQDRLKEMRLDNPVKLDLEEKRA